MTNQQTDVALRETLLWTAAALQAVCADGVVRESSTISIHDTKKSICEILDMADAALEPPRPDNCDQGE